MPFEIYPPEESPLAPDLVSDAEERARRSRQLALLPDGSEFELAPMQRRKPSLADVQSHIAHLSSQIDTLRRQLRDHPADRLAMLLREMIDERERELERWVAQEQRWDERVAAIEGAIAERDAHRRREAELKRERDEARREAVNAGKRVEAAQAAAEEARRKAATLERAAEKAQTEQIRLRQEREIDKTTWQSERRQLAAEAERVRDRGWLARIIRS